MDRFAADTALQDQELIPFMEVAVAQARELEQKFLENDIPVSLAKPPPKACCAKGCGCGTKVQLVGREADLQKIATLMRADWVEAVRREGTLSEDALVPLQLPTSDACPACGHQGELREGACGDCGLQLE